MAEEQKQFFEFGYPDERFETVISDNLHCAICSCVLKDPVMCKNEHCFCRGCITKHLENSQTCPSCNQDLTVESLAVPPRIIRNLLSEQKIRCDHHERGCQEIVQLGNLTSHVAVCGKAPVLCANEECSSQINREDQYRHQSEECRFREVKCRNCKEMGSMVNAIEAGLTGLFDHVGKLNTSVHEQSTKVKTGLTAVENRLEEMETKFQEMENKFENKFEKMQNEFEKVENQFLKVEVDQQRDAMNDDRESARSDQASNVKDAKNPNEYAYVVAGGYEKERKTLNSVEIYDKTSNSWKMLQPMKTDRAEASSIVYNGEVLVTGGKCDDINQFLFSNNYRSISNIELYRRNANPFVPPSWCNFPVNLPRELAGHRTVLYKNRVLVFGGYGNSYIIYEIQLDFPFNSKVLAKLPSPIPTTGFGVVLVNDKVLIFGGRVTEEWDSPGTERVTMYDIAKNEFQELEPLPYAVYNMATVKYGNTVILAGGQDSNRLGAGKKTVVGYDVETQNSFMLPPMKQERTDCCAIVDGNYLVVMGGRGQGGILDSVEAFDLRTSRWRKLRSMNEAREAFTAVVV